MWAINGKLIYNLIEVVLMQMNMIVVIVTVLNYGI